MVRTFRTLSGGPITIILLSLASEIIRVFPTITDCGPSCSFGSCSRSCPAPTDPACELTELYPPPPKLEPPVPLVELREPPPRLTVRFWFCCCCCWFCCWLVPPAPPVAWYSSV